MDEAGNISVSLNHLSKQHVALMNISRAVLAIKHVDDMESVVRVMFEQMKAIEIDFAGLSFQRLTDAETQTFEQHHLRPDGKYHKQIQSRPTTFREWQAQHVLYRRDLALPEYQEGMGDHYKGAYRDLGLQVRCILHLPNRYGVLTMRSETPHAFSDTEVVFIEDLAVMLDLAISRLGDLERLEIQNAELAQANASLQAEIEERKKAEAAMVEVERLQVLMQTAGGAAHEISQPLTAIVGQAELLLMRLPENDPCRNRIKDILDSGLRISNIVQKMKNIRQYASQPYIEGVDIVDFDAAAGSKDEE